MSVPYRATSASTPPCNPVVMAVDGLNFDGNIIPHNWYFTPLLKHENGKPNLVAIILLSDILYWYRPTVELYEGSSRIKSYRAKFAGDKLFVRYDQWSEKFGLTKRQVQDGVSFLAQQGIVTREVRAIDGYNNRVYLEPVIDVVRMISIPIVDDIDATEEASRYNVTRPTMEREASYTEALSPSPSNVRRHTSKGSQDTKSPTETTTETTAKKRDQHTAHTATSPTKPQASNVVVLSDSVSSNATSEVKPTILPTLSDSPAPSPIPADTDGRKQVFDLLQAAGITPDAACHTLLAVYGVERCRRQVESGVWKNKPNPAGYLRRAIEQDYKIMPAKVQTTRTIDPDAIAPPSTGTVKLLPGEVRGDIRELKAKLKGKVDSTT